MRSGERWEVGRAARGHRSRWRRRGREGGRCRVERAGGRWGVRMAGGMHRVGQAVRGRSVGRVGHAGDVG
jgi:hypothetical protein